MIGIYKITNKVNGHSYIGQSVDIARRWRQHRNLASNPNDSSYNNPLYRAIRKYGIDNFVFEIIEECSVDKLNELEQYYIEKFNTFFDGYNLTLGGDAAQKTLLAEQIKGIIDDLENTTLTQEEIANKWRVHKNTVQTINVGKHWHLNREYPIRQVHKAEKNYCIDCGIEITKGSKRCKKCFNIAQHYTSWPTREELKNMIRKIPFTQIGKTFNVSDNAIRRWCEKYHLPKTKTEIKKYTDEEWEKI